MSISTDLTSAKNVAAAEFDKVTNGIETEVDKMVLSINTLSSRVFKETESVFSVVEAHLAADARLGVEEAKKLVAAIKAKL